VRRRITVAILGVVIGALVLTVAGSVLLVRRAAITSAENQVVSEAQALGTLVSINQRFTDVKDIEVLREVGAFDDLRVVGVGPGGAVSSLPAPLTLPVVDVGALAAGHTVAGNVGYVVFVAQPLSLTVRQRASLAGGLPVRDLPVLVVTRHVRSPFSGLAYFVLVAAVVLVAGIAVAAVLARRISAPLLRAVEATRQMAGGNLAATVPVSPHDYPELAELAGSINTLGEHLSRSQGLEREFLLSVSHELRTPLTSIRGYADAIADGATDDVPGAVAIVGAEARRLERLVQDLLDLARLQTSQFSLQAQRVDAGGLVAAAAEGFHPEADAAGVALTSVTSPGLWVVADGDRLGQILANLVENALKFTATEVEVGAGRVGTWVALWVVDDGPGIDPGDLPHVFERHYTSDRLPARKTGAGLGLAIVAELAAAMGAEVRAESPVRAGHGARMVVWLPSADAGGVLHPPAPAGATGPGGGGTPPGASRAARRPGPADPGGPTSALPLRPPA